jgi:hypothetical protein
MGPLLHTPGGTLLRRHAGTPYSALDTPVAQVEDENAVLGAEPKWFPWTLRAWISRAGWSPSKGRGNQRESGSLFRPKHSHAQGLPPSYIHPIFDSNLPARSTSKRAE